MARALTFANQFDPGAVDPRLIEVLDLAAQRYAPYGVEATSGFRTGDKRQHGRHAATDVRLRDKKTRAALANYQSPETFKAYQDYANLVRAAQQELYPDLDKALRWGGYFSGGKDTYGALDLMHFDLGGGPNLGMAGGSWEGGLTPEQAKIWGLDPGTTEAIAQQPPDVQRAFLSTIAGTESPGYDVLYGGGKFRDYSRHPNAKIPIMSGPNKGDYSSAAGRYQFLGSTWEDLAKRHGYKDFSPANQDAGAWALANEQYKAATGGSLEEALQSGDPGRINAAASVLAKTWTSLPGGIEQAKGYGTGTFADAFRKNLGVGGPAGPVEAAGGGAGSEAGAGAQPAPVGPAVADAGTWWQKLARDFGKGGATVATAMGTQQPRAGARAPIPAARIDQGEVPTIDPQQAEAQRNQLAMALARLNSGRLFG